MSEPAANRLDYRSAGVDIDAGNALVERIKPIAARTRIPGVLAGLGGFGSLFELPKDRFRNPVLVAGTDGVGTKLKLAQQLGRHDGIGIDLVAMCVNDIVVQGAEPLFFLDYFACGKLDVEVATAVIASIGQGCEQAGCALVGGETAEMPGMYAPGDYDLAGFCVGAVEKDNILDGSKVRRSDILIGLAASGPHANGYSLIRKIIERSGADLAADLDGVSLAGRLMAPTRIYVKPLLQLMTELPVHALAHVTGGGLTENLPRVLPKALCAVIDLESWQRPALFRWLEQHVAENEMLRTFNCGIGMILCVPSSHAETAIARLNALGENAMAIGEIVATRGDKPIRYANQRG